MYIRLALLMLAGSLAGCWQENTPAPPGAGADPSPWRADLTTTAAGHYFRIDPSPAFWQWADAHDMHRFEVVDAHGEPQMCDAFDVRRSVNAFAMSNHTEALVVQPFDTGTCAAPGTPLPVCLRDCTLPAYCPRSTLAGKLPRSANPALFRTLQDVLAAANATIVEPDCRPATSRADRICDDTQMIAMRNAILPLQLRLHARGALLRDGLAVDPTGPRSALETVAMPHGGTMLVRRSAGALGGVALRPAGTTVLRDETPLTLTAQALAPPADARGGQLLRLHASVLSSDLTLTFDRPITQLPLQFIAYHADGREFGVDLPDVRFARNNPPTRGTQVGAVFAFATSDTDLLRFIPPDDTPGLRLVGAAQVTHVAKPFVHADRPTYWFKAAGVAPYRLLIDTGGMNSCGSGGIQMPPAEAQATDEWPPPAALGDAYANPARATSAASALSGSPGLTVWLAGAALVWLTGLVAVLLSF